MQISTIVFIFGGGGKFEWDSMKFLFCFMLFFGVCFSKFFFLKRGRRVRGGKGLRREQSSKKIPNREENENSADFCKLLYRILASLLFFFFL